jgi:hypothetical protein
MTCLITGCALYLQHSEVYVWGDLHLIGGSFVFNGCIEPLTGGLRWETDSTPPRNRRALVIPVGEHYFERRGVLVVRASRSLLNAEARDYVGDAPHCPVIPE